MSSESQLQHRMVHAHTVSSYINCSVHANDQSSCVSPTQYFFIELSKRYEATHIFIFHQPSFQRSQV